MYVWYWRWWYKNTFGHKVPSIRTYNIVVSIKLVNGNDIHRKGHICRTMHALYTLSMRIDLLKECAWVEGFEYIYVDHRTRHVFADWTINFDPSRISFFISTNREIFFTWFLLLLRKSDKNLLNVLELILYRGLYDT